jgi:autophagy-related protein 18
MTLWDMEHSYTLREALFPDTVLRVLTNHSRVVAVTRSALYLYNTATMNPTILPTVDNPKGLAALSPSSVGNLLAFPSSEAVGNFKLYDAVTLNQQAEVEAHKAPLSALALSQDGVHCATASRRGTVIRVFSLYTLQKLYTYKRGLGSVDLEYLCFATAKPILISCSASGTVHLFKVKEDRREAWGSSFFQRVYSVATTVIPESFSDSLKAPKSFMQIKTGHGVQARAILLSNPDRLFVASFNGAVQVFRLNLSTGESKLMEESTLLSLPNIS